MLVRIYKCFLVVPLATGVVLIMIYESCYGVIYFGYFMDAVNKFEVTFTLICVAILETSCFLAHYTGLILLLIGYMLAKPSIMKGWIFLSIYSIIAGILRLVYLGFYYEPPGRKSYFSRRFTDEPLIGEFFGHCIPLALSMHFILVVSSYCQQIADDVRRRNRTTAEIAAEENAA